MKNKIIEVIEKDYGMDLTKALSTMPSRKRNVINLDVRELKENELVNVQRTLNRINKGYGNLNVTTRFEKNGYYWYAIIFTKK